MSRSIEVESLKMISRGDINLIASFEFFFLFNFPL